MLPAGLAVRWHSGSISLVSGEGKQNKMKDAKHRMHGMRNSPLHADAVLLSVV